MKAAAYARYSTDLQTENSIAYQLDKIRAYCKENNITLCATYTDEAQSGTNLERPGFQSLLNAAKRHDFEAVIIYDISRGSRDVGDWFTFRKTMMLLHIQVISVTQQLGDITKSNDFLLELISVGMGQTEVLNTRSKSIDGVAVKAKQGVFLGGVAPLGYDIVNGQYVINPTEAETVRTIFSMYADGYGYSAILEAIKGATGKHGRPLGKNSLSSILRNERYIGVYTWNKRQFKLMRKWAGGGPNPNYVRIEDSIEPIIDKETWERLHKRMDDRKRNACSRAKQPYLLSGLIECEECGSTYVGHSSTNRKGYEHRSYFCGSKYRTRTCHSKNISADVIETFVVQQLKAYLSKIDFTETAQYIADQINGASPDLSREKSELHDIEAKINNGVKAVLSGMVFPELDQELDRLRVRKSELEDIIAAHEINHKTVDPQAIVRLFEDSIRNWSPETIPDIIRQHVTKIYAHADGSFTVNVGVFTNGCGGAQYLVYTTFHYPAA